METSNSANPIAPTPETAARIIEIKYYISPGDATPKKTSLFQTTPSGVPVAHVLEDFGLKTVKLLQEDGTTVYLAKIRNVVDGEDYYTLFADAHITGTPSTGRKWSVLLLDFPFLSQFYSS